ncbi:MSMEG_1061 family FMN-dependent PPOX-type flavoprotein [Pseudonocardia broussonetiae]|uniref:Pyridoxamine 5'-phosphate oxidase family protein n=1 Tax=Pseudonocardia broussonetiae TaxID=2736640 RepID=A0A6M6JLR0_9PSEU|nr:MSMEG_1061 family FMN-dependent PPOX-type flavoprotein [Pseudonocardia broussonetiae]QJY48255.1 pyridoxamine 5'-phosphate oxidase family protein [Pseudonocardia broussonetiae]
MTGFATSVTSPEQLAELYRPPNELVARKKIDHVDAGAAALIAASPFVLVSTSGADGRCTVSPRGGEPGFVQVLDPGRIAVPDFAGNNLLDSMRHLLGNPHVGLLFLLPGRPEVLRVEGSAVVTVDEDVLERAVDHGKRPVAAIGVTVESVFVHCSASLRRGGLWEPDSWGRVEAPTTSEVVRGHLALTEAPA